MCGCLWMWWGRTALLLPEGLAGELPGQKRARRRAGPWCWRNSCVWASPERWGPGRRGSQRALFLQTSPGVASTRRAASGPGGAKPRGARQCACRAVPCHAVLCRASAGPGGSGGVVFGSGRSQQSPAAGFPSAPQPAPRQARSPAGRCLRALCNETPRSLAVSSLLQGCEMRRR